MVYECDGEDNNANSRKRSYPWIQWLQSENSVNSRTSSDQESGENFDSQNSSALTLPPLHSKRKTFKHGLDKFSGSYKIDCKKLEEESETVIDRGEKGSLRTEEVDYFNPLRLGIFAPFWK